MIDLLSDFIAWVVLNPLEAYALLVLVAIFILALLRKWAGDDE